MVLLLVPTSYESKILLGQDQDFQLDDNTAMPQRVLLGGSKILVSHCGFGLVASGIRTLDVLTKIAGSNEPIPSRVILAGIAGSYSSEIPAGQAAWGDRVRCFGIGVGEGESFKSAESLGWRQLPDACEGSFLLAQPESGSKAGSVAILSVTAASDSEKCAAIRQRAEPEAVLEEMEGFAVAMACHRFGIPLSIVRGVSNRAGSRDKSSWKVSEALAAVRAELLRELED
jgi:futalosine hydrolase